MCFPNVYHYDPLFIPYYPLFPSITHLFILILFIIVLLGVKPMQRIIDILPYNNNNYYPAPAAAGAAPPQNQGNREARSAIYATYATAAVPIFDHVFFCSS